MTKNFDGALKPADIQDIAAVIFEAPGKPDTALQFSPELAFLFNGNAESKLQGLHAIDLMMSGVDPEVALNTAYDNLRVAVMTRHLN